MQVVFKEAGETPPFRLVNESSVALTFHQKDVDRVSTLEPNQTTDYAWDDLYKVIAPSTFGL